jgi:hypothetical protein
MISRKTLPLLMICLYICTGFQQEKSKAPEKPLTPFSMHWENSKNSKLNLSFLLDKPAGQSGFIRIKDGHLAKPSGERLRLWGVDLTGGACFPEKKDAPLVAAYLARFGMNAVRLHFLDSNWGQERSLFNFSLETTRELSAAQLDKLDYFISELKKAGIYTDINLNVGRTYRKNDGVPEYESLGFGKGATLFDDRLIELQKEYATQLLTHVNPYTGKSYVNEPAIAFVELVNENSLVEAWFGGRLLGEKTSTESTTWMDIPPSYGKELTEKYNTWLNLNLSKTDIAAIEKEAGVTPGSTIPRLKPREFKDASTLRFHSESRFIIETERKFYTGMYDFLKNNLNVKSLIIANSDHNHYNSGYALLSNTSLLDVVDGHVYWQHPSDKTDEKTGKKYSVIENSPMVNDPGFSTVVQLSRSAVEGKPFIVSETNHPFPNEYACEGIPILAAYASLQDWDGIFYYTFEHVSPDKWNANYSGSFGMALDPVKMAGMAVSGLQFSRGNLKASESCIYRGYSENQIIEGIRGKAGAKPYFTNGFSPLLPLMSKTRVRSFVSQTDAYPLNEESKEIKSETGQIIWHTGGNNYVEAASDQMEMITGYIPENATITKHLKANLENSFASVQLITLDNQPIGSSRKMLLVATGKSGVTGMKWSDDRKRLLEPGAKPTTIEVIKGNIQLTGIVSKSISVEPLDGNGDPISNTAVKVKKGTASFVIGNVPTVWYYITVN